MQLFDISSAMTLGEIPKVCSSQGDLLGEEVDTHALETITSSSRRSHSSFGMIAFEVD
jgi:hypothetical protein